MFRDERVGNFLREIVNIMRDKVLITVVTMHTTAPSSVVAPVKDAHAASVVPNARAAHETTAVHLLSSNGR